MYGLLGTRTMRTVSAVAELLVDLGNLFVYSLYIFSTAHV